MLLLQNTEILLYAGVAYVWDLKFYFWTRGHNTSQKKSFNLKKYVNSPKYNTPVKNSSEVVNNITEVLKIKTRIPQIISTELIVELQFICTK